MGTAGDILSMAFAADDMMDRKEKEREELIDACFSVHQYFMALCVKWNQNEGRVTMTEKSGIISGDDTLEELCNKAARKVETILEKVGKISPHKCPACGNEIPKDVES